MSSSLTASQQTAVAVRGKNVIVVAGAGTGKTRTLVERCLSLVLEGGCAVDRILMVTFTEAAAAEMRKRIREALDARAEQQGGFAADGRIAEQLALLDLAPIGTLHSFCLDLVRQHFHELQLDPAVTVLDDAQVQPLIRRTLDELFEQFYRREAPLSDGAMALVREYGRGSDEGLRALVIRIHRFAQTLPDPEAWLQQQAGLFASPHAEKWQRWLEEEFTSWAGRWIPALTAQPPENAPARASADALAAVVRREGDIDLHVIREAADKILEADDALWPARQKTRLREPIEKFFDEAAVLASFTRIESGTPVIEQDWNWIRGHMRTLLAIAERFEQAFRRAKRELGGVDFSDIEQLALRLLVDAEGQPTQLARELQERFDAVFVDEYQDINAAQDAILRAVSRAGARANRFLVGDAKQSIYGFRLANPAIFRRYETSWTAEPATAACIALSDNFRSHEAVLHFVNALFGSIMRESVGGLGYGADECLQFGDPERRTPLKCSAPGSEPARVELHFITADEPEAANGDGNSQNGSEGDPVELESTECEARLVGARLRALRESAFMVWDDGAFRPVKWRDMVILLRAPGGRAETYAKEFHRLGIPLRAERGGFYAATEVADILNALKLLDNPLQDVPLLTVLRSPLVCFTLNELACVRAHSREKPFWTALRQFHREQQSQAAAKATPIVSETWTKADLFLAQFSRWRRIARQNSLSDCIEAILADTQYEALLLAGDRGSDRLANVERLLALAREYDPHQRQGLYRFLRFIEAQEDSEVDREPIPPCGDDAVRLMSIHKSKGLEFPVVVLADTGKQFNQQSLRDDVLLNEQFGLCPAVKPPGMHCKYPSVAHWLARQRAHRELLGEEMRLLYVATTRARDLLLITGTLKSTAEDLHDRWEKSSRAAQDDELTRARNLADWLVRWMATSLDEGQRLEAGTHGSTALFRWQLHAPSEIVAISRDAIEAGDQVQDHWHPTDQTAHEMAVRLAWQYPFQRVTCEATKTSVSAVRKRAMADEESRWLFRFSALHGARDRRTRARPGAAEIGTAHHRFLELCSLEELARGCSIQSEIERLAGANALAAAEAQFLDADALAAFWSSAVGQEILANRQFVRREVPFTTRLSIRELDEITGATGAKHLGEDITSASCEDEWLVVQGVADLIVRFPDATWLLDFKTDSVTARDAGAKAREYAVQLRLYAKALEQTYRHPVTRTWLHFLAARATVQIDSHTLHSAEPL